MRKTIETYVKRSQQAAFDLSIREGVVIPTESTESWENDLAMIRSTIRRCRELALLAEEYAWLRCLNNLSSADLQCLESVFIQLICPYPGNSDDDPFHLSAAQSLRYARLYVHYPTALQKIRLPFTQIQNLDCRIGCGDNARHWANPCGGLNAWRDMLSKCTNIRNVTVHLHGQGFLLFDVYNYLNPSIHDQNFRYARSLTVHVGFNIPLTTLLRGFSFLSLENFQFSSTGGLAVLFPEFETLEESLTTTLSYFSGLTVLRLLRIDISEPTLRTIFQDTPRLTSLDIMTGTYNVHEFKCDDSFVVHQLNLEHHNRRFAPLLPRLRDLRLYYCELEDYTNIATAARYVNLAISRFRWAKYNLDSESVDEGTADRDVLQNTPTYPFRLYLVFERQDFDLKSQLIGDAFPKTEYPVFWPEKCKKFGKEI